MSSTTDRRDERGQALVIFALAILVLGLVAALAFDMGMVMFERRDEQNAADAAALAGARCLEIPQPCDPATYAREVATLNGYTSGEEDTTVTVTTSTFRIQVDIARDLGSLFGGLAGRSFWSVGAFAVAINLNDSPPVGALVALSQDPENCPAFQITGTGIISSWGDVQVNSPCNGTPGDAFLVSGQGDLQLQQEGVGCYVVGTSSISGQGQASPLCNPPQQGAPWEPPIGGGPENLDWPNPPVQEGGTTKAIPSGCPGSTDTQGNPTAATDAAPATCQFQASYDGTTWRLYPGYYPGGIKLQAGTFYLEPGIYHLAGGGFVAVSTGVSVTSTDPGGTTLGGGVLLHNTTHAIKANGPIQIGGNGNSFNLWPLGGLTETCDGPAEGWNRYLIFQDPANSLEISISGGGNVNSARGLILAPTANVKMNGGGGTLTIDAVIAYTFKVNGNEGTINVLYNPCALPTFQGYGLINPPSP